MGGVFKSLPESYPVSATRLSKVTLEVVPEETLPLAIILSASWSWTFIKSPGRRKEALIPVVKLTSSVSSVSVRKCHLPNLCACPSEVTPNATTSLVIILPVESLLSVSYIVRTLCLKSSPGLFDVTLIWFGLARSPVNV